MSATAKVIILDSDPVASAQLSWSLGRVGLSSSVLPLTTDPATVAGLFSSGAQAVVLADHRRAMLESADRADPKPLLDHTRALRVALDDAGISAPMIVVGEKIRRGDAEAAGATEALAHPVHARDLTTTLSLMLSATKPWSGNLSDVASVYRLLRGLCGIGRSGVLSMMRGLRRGEVRFYQGEITSAQVGLTHGQSALHQLLLWTDARFDFRREDIVRRQQIPLAMADLFTEAQRFMDRMRESSGGLSPADRLERDEAKISQLGPAVPKPVADLLRLFDSNRTLADVLEDSPYRQFETLRVTLRAVESGVLRQVVVDKPNATWRAVLAIEEWLVGIDRTTAQQRVLALARDADSAKDQVPASTTTIGKKGKKKKRTRAHVPVGTVTQPITWGDLIPRESSMEIEAVSQVVPVAEVSGEIAPREVAPSRDSNREGLEHALDTGARQRVFVSDLGTPTNIDQGEVSGEINLPRQLVEQRQASQRSRSETNGAERSRPLPAQHKPAPSQPSEAGQLVFVADAELAKAMAMKAAASQAAQAPSATPSSLAAQAQAGQVAEVSKDARRIADEFTDDEEHFFATAANKTAPVVAVEQFSDLDEGYEHQSFWDRLWGKRTSKRR
jgi:hypothetical protein